MNVQNIPIEERVVIGSILTTSSIFLEMHPVVKPDDFSSAECSYVYEAFCKLVSDNVIIDVVTTSNEIKKMGLRGNLVPDQLLYDLRDSYSGYEDVVAYAEIIRDRSMRSKIRRLGSGLSSVTEADDPKAICDSAYVALVDLVSQSSSKSAESIGSVLSDLKTETRKIMDNEIARTGIKTGIHKLDIINGMIEPSDLFIVAARPSCGKTVLGTNIAVNVSKYYGPVLFCSIEMAKKQLAQRIIASEAEIPLTRITTSYMSKDDWRRFEAAVKAYERMNLFIDDSSTQSLMDIRTKAREIQSRRGLSLIVVDYMQLITSRNEYTDEFAQVTASSKGLKAIAKDLNVPVVALSQLRRPERGAENRRPTLSDLRSSGQIEQDADGVVFIHTVGVSNQDEKMRDVELIIAKRRQGETGICEVVFNRPFQKFV